MLLAACTQHISIHPSRVRRVRALVRRGAAAHVIAAGDEIELRFLLNPELNDAKLIIGPDGRVTVPLLGPVTAGGLTVAEFRGKLEQAYASKLRVADLDVVIRTYGSSRIFVGGDVKTPGVLALQGPTDVLQGVLMAGGFLHVRPLRRGRPHPPPRRPRPDAADGEPAPLCRVGEPGG